MDDGFWVAIVGSRRFGNCPCLKRPAHFPPTDAERRHLDSCPAIVARALVRRIVIRWSGHEGFAGIVSGDCPDGADKLAKEACELLGVTYKGFPVPSGKEPFWKRAKDRNTKVAAKAAVVVALFAPGPRSPGTTDTVEKTIAMGKPVHIFHMGVWTTS